MALTGKPLDFRGLQPCVQVFRQGTIDEGAAVRGKDQNRRLDIIELRGQILRLDEFRLLVDRGGGALLLQMADPHSKGICREPWVGQIPF